LSAPDDDDRSLTELEFVEVAVRRAAHLMPERTSRAFLRVADELMTADTSQLDGGSDTRLWELNRLRRGQL
jgi:hypothetical protein